MISLAKLRNKQFSGADIGSKFEIPVESSSLLMFFRVSFRFRSAALFFTILFQVFLAMKSCEKKSRLVALVALSFVRFNKVTFRTFPFGAGESDDSRFYFGSGRKSEEKDGKQR